VDEQKMGDQKVGDLGLGDLAMGGKDGLQDVIKDGGSDTRRRSGRIKEK
jgi:hypothetical protein